MMWHPDRRAMCLAVIVLCASCTGEKGTVPVLQSAVSTLGTLALSPRNAIIAVGGTVQVNAVGQSLSGAPITSFDSVRYLLNSITDTLRVRVSSDGLVTGRASSGIGTDVKLNVFAYKDGVGQGDQAIIQVTPTAVSGLTLSIQPVPPDSARMAMRITKTIVPRLQNLTTGVRVPSPRMRYAIHTPSGRVNFLAYSPLLTLPPGIGAGIVAYTTTSAAETQIRSMFPGTGWIYAEVNAYGSTLRDSVLYTATAPFTGSITVSVSQSLLATAGVGQSEWWFAPRATVTFQNFVAWSKSDGTLDGLPLSYVFDNPAAATAGGGSGDILNLAPGESTTRRFLTPGTYTWTATVGGNLAPLSGQTVTGKIIVQ